MRDDEIDTLAERLLRAFEANDPEEIAAVCEPSAIFMRDGKVLGDVEAMLPVFATLRSRIGRHRYIDVERRILPDGFVETHGVEMVRDDGEVVLSAARIVGRVGPGDRFVELAEYSRLPDGRFADEVTAGSTD